MWLARTLSNCRANTESCTAMMVAYDRHRRCTLMTLYRKLCTVRAICVFDATLLRNSRIASPERTLRRTRHRNANLAMFERRHVADLWRASSR